MLRRDGEVEAAVYNRMALAVGATFAGPAIFEQPDTTTLLPPGWTARVLETGSLLLQRDAKEARR